MSATKPSLTIRRRIKAPPSKVFSAWTEPANLLQWWGPDDGPVLHAETDLRVGGKFRVAFRMLDGEEHDSGGTYREIVPDEKLVFTWHWANRPEEGETLVTVLLQPDGDGTLMTFTHAQFQDEPTRDEHHEGWSGALDKLERLFA
ncbi:MAG: ATPase [Rhodospirillales bacterium]|nr:ATPase [Rhodospirillales bacterium]